MSRIFLSYRREDASAYAGRVYDRLVAHFGAGQVFMDIDQIEPGEDFVQVIDRKVGACETAVVLIGKGWLSASDGEGRRLDNPEDFVRLEVAAALQRNVRVVPVLVGGAAMPRMQQLPEPLALLSRRNALEISDTRFHSDVDRLIKALERAQPMAAETSARPEPPAEEQASARPRAAPAPAAKRTSKRWALDVAMAAIGLIAIVAFFVPGRFGGSTPDEPVEAAAATPAESTAANVPDVNQEGKLAQLRAERSSVRSTASGTIGLGEPLAPEIQRRASAGSAESQYLLAVTYECGEAKRPSEALRWYQAAAAQGHQPAREALHALQQPLPSDASARESRSIRLEMDCLSRLQKQLSKDLEEMDNKAREAIRSIKAG